MSLWGILGKQKDIIFIIVKRTKCLLLETLSFLRKSFSQKKLVGAQCNLKKFKKHKKNVSVPIDEVQHDESAMVADQHDKPQPRRSIRARRAPKKYTLLTTGQCDILLLNNEEPNTYMEVVMGPESERLFEAMRSEM